MNKLPNSMKNVGEKIKNIHIPNVFPEPLAAGVGNVGERKTLGELFSVAKSETKGTGNGNRLNLEDITSGILKTKPMNSPKHDKWYKKGGSISIDDNGTWTYTNKSGVSVNYPNGYPDFTPYMHPNIKPVQIEVHSPKNNPKDFENANIAAKLTKDTDPPIIDNQRPPEGYTWHHHEDGKTMMLVMKISTESLDTLVVNQRLMGKIKISNDIGVRV
ncbi:HNH endonuclease [Bacillus mycoides]|uniref:HNH endonuclease n=1 Tax=Bacillus mycoides TaxID=1405 RepID=UPI001E442029|nr:HNH endonuclease [Bacillus mycoides]MED1629262.1 HNH endonuclease [Bacillus mycoides]